MIINNLTNPGAEPVDGDMIEIIGQNFSKREQFNAPLVPTAEEIASDARGWRNMEIQMTDWVVPLTDHPQHAAYITYRAALRAWPSTGDFPATKPVLG